ncbi:MAG: diguanylate cyclase [Gammaproteobacteria bacterium]|nr:diguanylate cyclase [Gammaproteobacteria bacterium]
MVDTIDDQMAVLDSTGEIIFVNKAWRYFASENGFPCHFRWLGINYISVCSNSASQGDSLAGQIALKMQKVLQGYQEEMEIDYPCHSKQQQRWFMMQMRAFRDAGETKYLVSHRNITSRKLAEKKAEKLSLEDTLTGLANRRKFNNFLANEWRRCTRAQSPLSLIMIDVDSFKQYNDEFGHIVGDKCLRFIGAILSDAIKRPADLAARFGGEEFAIVLSETDSDGAYMVAEQLRQKVAGISAYEGLPRAVTISLGVATSYPEKDESRLALIEKADEALYKAKCDGKNRTNFYCIAR